MKNSLSVFGDYVRDVFDFNGDGKVSVKEFLSSFGNSTIIIAFLVVDMLVLVAEYRVWDVGMKITGDPYKALGFVLVSALPFYLSQILWIYPRATRWQQGIALLMGGSALITSARFGLADLSQSYDIKSIISMVVNLTVAYIIALLVYILIDKGIQANRMKVKARANAAMQKEFNKIAREVLADLEVTKEEEDKIRARFGDGAVDNINKQLQRKKQRGQQMVAYAEDANFTNRQQS